MSQGSLFAAGGARLDAAGRFRYELWRDLGDEGHAALFILLNPSTADAHVDDPTVRRCIDYSRRWGYGYLRITNLYALRSPDPCALEPDPVYAAGDPENLATIIRLAKQSALVVCGWGAKIGRLGGPRRDALVAAMLEQSGAPPLHCLDTTKEGHPAHPLYLPARLKPRPFALPIS